MTKYLRIITYVAKLINVSVYLAKFSNSCFSGCVQSHTWLSCAWLLINLHWAVTFEVQGSKVTGWYFTRLISILVISGTKNSFIRACDQLNIKKLDFLSMEGNRLIQGTSQIWSITERHPAEPSTTTMAPPCRSVRFVLHLASWLSPRCLLKSQLLAEVQCLF